MQHIEDQATEETIARLPAGEKADVNLVTVAARRPFKTGPLVAHFTLPNSAAVWNCRLDFDS
jgi:phenylacetaldehyde dehydrogenase